MDKTYQKLESRAFTFCYPVPRTLQNLKNQGLHKNLGTLKITLTLFLPPPQTVRQPAHGIRTHPRPLGDRRKRPPLFRLGDL